MEEKMMEDVKERTRCRKQRIIVEKERRYCE
jgi:hypothetical protein